MDMDVPATAPLAPVPFWFLRHGQTDWNKTNLAQGRTDVPLNEAGFAQARAAAALLRGRGIARIAASPLARARATAEIVAEALAVPLSFDDDLREACFGAAEGKPMLAAWFSDWINGIRTPPQAETFAAVSARSVRAVNRILPVGPGPVLIVAHGAVFRGLRAAMGLSPQERLTNAEPTFCAPGGNRDGNVFAPWQLSTLR